MDRYIKSICHAFRANDIEIYTPDGNSDYFFATHLICSNCKHFWYTDLFECYLCGEINYGIGVCPKNHHISLTASSKKCKHCGLTREKKCINSECPTNTDKIMKNILSNSRKKGTAGVFERGSEGSSMKISQNYCLNCGETRNQYRHFQVFVEEYDARTSHDIISKHVEPSYVVIFKKRLPTLEYPTKPLEYAYFEGSHDPANWQPNWTGLSQTIEQMFS